EPGRARPALCIPRRERFGNEDVGGHRGSKEFDVGKNLRHDEPALDLAPLRLKIAAPDAETDGGCDVAFARSQLPAIRECDPRRRVAPDAHHPCPVLRALRSLVPSLIPSLVLSLGLCDRLQQSPSRRTAVQHPWRFIKPASLDAELRELLSSHDVKSI